MSNAKIRKTMKSQPNLISFNFKHSFHNSFMAFSSLNIPANSDKARLKKKKKEEEDEKEDEDDTETLDPLKVHEIQH